MPEPGVDRLTRYEALDPRREAVQAAVKLLWDKRSMLPEISEEIAEDVLRAAIPHLDGGAVDDLRVAVDLLSRSRCTDLGTDDKSWWSAQRKRLAAKWGQ